MRSVRWLGHPLDARPAEQMVAVAARRAGPRRGAIRALRRRDLPTGVAGEWAAVGRAALAPP